MTPLRVFRKTTPLVNAIRLSLLPLVPVSRFPLLLHRLISHRDRSTKRSISMPHTAELPSRLTPA